MERWKQNLYVVGISQLLGFATITFIMSFLPLYVKALGVTDPGQAAVWSGILMGTAAMFAALSGPVWGNLGDRRGRKVMVERVLVANTLITLLMGYSTNVWHMFVLRVLQGTLGGFNAASLALVTSLTPTQNMGFALGFYQFAMTAGSALGPLIGGYLADTLNFRWAFIILACFTFAATAVVHFGVHEEFTPPKQESKGWGFFSGLRRIFTNRTLLAMLLVNFLVQFSLMVVAPIIPLFIHSLDPGSSRVITMTGLIIAAGGVSSALSAVYLGSLSDKIGHKKTLLIMTLGAAAASLLQLAAINPWQFLAFRIIGGICMGGMLPAANALIYSLIPSDQRGTALGVSTSFTLMGNVLGPISGGLLGASALGYRGVFAVTAGLLFATAVWISRIVKAPYEQGA